MCGAEVKLVRNRVQFVRNSLLSLRGKSVPQNNEVSKDNFKFVRNTSSVCAERVEFLWKKCSAQK